MNSTRTSGLHLADALGQLGPRHLGHHHVGEEDVERRRGRQLQRLRPTARLQDLVAVAARMRADTRRIAASSSTNRIVPLRAAGGGDAAFGLRLAPASASAGRQVHRGSWCPCRAPSRW